MKTLRIFLTIMIAGSLSFAVKGQSTLALVESSGDGCGSISDCDANTVCFDIVLTPAVTANLQSYNIWLQYTGTGLSYLSDAACITQNGNDNDQDTFQYYRVAGINGAQQVMTGVPVIIHNVCFTFDDTDNLDGLTIFVGGTVFDVLFTTLTYNFPPSNEPMVPAFPFLMNSGSVSCLEVLPLGLLSFEAYKEGRMAVLEWTTVNEEGDIFEIERSVDGVGFQKIGVQPSSGVEGEVKPFTYIDQHPARGRNYYRIQEVGKDGSRASSPIRQVSFDEASQFVSLWPNPVTSRELFVHVSNAYEMETEIRVVSMAGVELFEKKIVGHDIHERLDLRLLTPGVYSLIVESVEERHTEKIVVLE
jgi:hypothetical protein